MRKSIDSISQRRLANGSSLVPEGKRIILDNADVSFSSTSTQAIHDDAYVGHSATELVSGQTASWTFKDLQPGTYLIASSAIPNASHTSLDFVVQDASQTTLSAGTLEDLQDDDSSALSRSYTTRHDVYPFEQDVFDEAFFDTRSSEPTAAFSAPEERRWLALDRVTFAGGDLTVQFVGSATSVPADAVRIDRFAQPDALLAPLSMHAHDTTGHLAESDSPVLDQGSESLFQGIHSTLVRPLSSDHRDQHLWLASPERFVRGETNLDIPEFPYALQVGAERLRVLGHDPLTDSLIVERGTMGTRVDAHAVGEIAIHGFAGLNTFLVAPVSAEESSIRVNSIAGLPRTLQFNVRVGGEEMTVSNVIDHYDGTMTFEVIREVRDSVAAPIVAVDTHVLVLVDQSGANRMVDGNQEGTVGIDFGALETLHVRPSTFVDDVDHVPGDGIVSTSSGEKSLRAAIMEANAFGGATVIHLGTGTYSLSLSGTEQSGAIDALGDFDVTGYISIVGEGADRTLIDGAELDRVFDVHPNAILRLQGVTVTGGQTNGDGGAVRIQNGKLFVIDSLLDSSSAERGGGVFAVESDVTVLRSTIASNSATSGGGIHHDGRHLSIDNSTISMNQASGTAGAVFVSHRSTATIQSSTVTKNHAGEDGGIVADGIVTLTTTVVAGNAQVADGAADVKGRFESTGYNFIGQEQANHSTTVYEVIDGPGAEYSVVVTDVEQLPAVPFDVLIRDERLTVTEVAGNTLYFESPSVYVFYPYVGDEVRFAGFWSTNDWVGRESELLPLLGPLGNHGGTTPTHLPLANSPLIDAGPSAEGIANLGTDQRGELRYFDDDLNSLHETDIGAVELNHYVEIAHATVVEVETDTGSSQVFTFAIRRSHGDSELTVDFATGADGNDPVEATDFVAGEFPTGTVTLAPGELVKTFEIEILGDDMVEPDEEFSVYLTNLSEPMAIRNPMGRGVVRNDDSTAIVLTGEDVIERTAWDENGQVDDTIFYIDATLTNDIEGGLTAEWVQKSYGGAAEEHSDRTLQYMGVAGETITLTFSVKADDLPEADWMAGIYTRPYSATPKALNEQISYGSVEFVLLDDDWDGFTLGGNGNGNDDNGNGDGGYGNGDGGGYGEGEQVASGYLTTSISPEGEGDGGYGDGGYDDGNGGGQGSGGDSGSNDAGTDGNAGDSAGEWWHGYLERPDQLALPGFYDFNEIDGQWEDHTGGMMEPPPTPAEQLAPCRNDPLLTTQFQKFLTFEKRAHDKIDQIVSDAETRASTAAAALDPDDLQNQAGSAAYQAFERAIGHLNAILNMRFEEWYGFLPPVCVIPAEEGSGGGGDPVILATGSEPVVDITIEENTSTPWMSFEVFDDITPSANLTLRATSTNTTLLPESAAHIKFDSTNDPNGMRQIQLTPVANRPDDDPSESTIVTIEVEDQHNNVSTLAFTLTVLQVNNRPEIDDPGEFEIDENDVGDLGTLTATDIEGDTLVDWRIDSGTHANLFAIDASSGLLSVPADTVVDYETIGNSLTLDVSVFDGTDRSNPFSVVININDLDDLPPTVSVSGPLQVHEDEDVGFELTSTPVSEVTASDPDPSGIISAWEIVNGNDDGIFGIEPDHLDPTNGIISVIDRSKLDFEATETYTLGVIARDSEGNESSPTSVTINVLNIIEGPEIEIEDQDGNVVSHETGLIDFGEVEEGDVSEVTLTIYNRGDSNLDVDSLNVLVPSGFSITPLTPGDSIPADGSSTFTLTLDTTTRGIQFGDVTIPSNDSLTDGIDESLFKFSVNAEVVEPDLGKAPTTANTTIYVKMNADYQFESDDVLFADEDNDPLDHIELKSLPDGTLELTGTPITLADLASTEITQAHLDNGDLVYIPPTDQIGDPLTQFDFVVNDGQFDSEIHTISIEVFDTLPPPLVSGPGYVTDALPTIEWSDVPTADGYTVEIYNDESSSLVKTISISGGGTTQYALNLALADVNTYHSARVRGVEPSGVPGEWSNDIRFFVDQDVIDNGIENYRVREQTSDAGDPWYEEVGGWSIDNLAGVDGDNRSHASAPNEAYASWTFQVVPGFYQVEATWQADSANASDATFALLDGKEGPLQSSATVDQTQSPNGTSHGGTTWSGLGVIHATGSTLEVLLDDSETGRVVADAVRIVPVGNQAGDPFEPVIELRDQYGIPLTNGMNVFVPTASTATPTLHTINVTNTGTVTMNLNAQVSGSGSSGFTVLTPTLSIPAGESDNVVVQLGTVVGAFTETLTLNDGVNFRSLVLRGSVNNSGDLVNPFDRVIDNAEVANVTLGPDDTIPTQDASTFNWELATHSVFGTNAYQSGYNFGDPHYADFLFENVPDGLYQFMATWDSDVGKEDADINAQFLVYDASSVPPPPTSSPTRSAPGDDSVVNTILAQEFQPDDAFGFGVNWEHIGGATAIRSGSAVVRLVFADYYHEDPYLSHHPVIADAVRMRSLGAVPPIPAPKVDFSTVGEVVEGVPIDLGFEATSESYSLTLSNTTEREIPIDPIETLPTGFSVSGANIPAGTILAPGAAVSVQLSYAATEGIHSGEIEVPFGVGDAIRLNVEVSSPKSAPNYITVDDRDTLSPTTNGFETFGDWTLESNHQEAELYSDPRGSFVFRNLAPGTYVVAASWPHSDGHYINVPHAIRDNGRLLETVRIDQTSEPDDYSDGSDSYEVLGTYSFTGGTLTVDVSTRGIEFPSTFTHELLADKIQIHKVDTRPNNRSLTLPKGLPHTIDLRTDALLGLQPITIVSQPSNGTLTWSGSSANSQSGVVTYTPNSLNVDSDSFTYSLNGHQAVVDLTFVSGSPITHADTFDVSHGKPTIIDPRYNDIDPEGDQLRIYTTVNDHGHVVPYGLVQPEIGEVRLNADGTFTYYPDRFMWEMLGNHTVSFDYYVTGGTPDSKYLHQPKRGNVTLNVINHAPVLHAPDRWHTYASNSTNDVVLNRTSKPVVFDPDGDELVFEYLDWQAQADGSVYFADDGTLVFDAASQPTDFTGSSESLLYRVFDGHDYSEPGRTFLVTKPLESIHSQGSAVYDIFNVDSTLLFPNNYSEAVDKRWSLTSAPAISDRKDPATTSVGSAGIDLNSGGLLLSHGLDLDASPGDSGPFSLQYNSDSVTPRPVVQARLKYDGDLEVEKIDAKLTVYDFEKDGSERVEKNESTITYTLGADQVSGGDNELELKDGVLISLQTDKFVERTGIYNYSIDITVHPKPTTEVPNPDPFELRTNGRIPVVVRDGIIDPVYGGLAKGWGITGIPMMYRVYEDPTGPPTEVMMLSGDGRYRLYARVSDTHGDHVYRAIDPTTRAVLPYDYGTLNLRSDGDFEYTTAGGDYFKFKKFDYQLTEATGVVTTTYDVLEKMMAVTDRDPNAADPAYPDLSKYKWTYTFGYIDKSVTIGTETINIKQISQIQSFDETQTTFNYSGDDLQSIRASIPGTSATGYRYYNLTNASGGTLTEISEGIRDRVFTYDAQSIASRHAPSRSRTLITSEKLVDIHDDSTSILTEFEYDEAGLLDKIKLGSGHGSDYSVDPRAAAALDLTKTGSVNAYTYSSIVPAADQFATIEDPTSQVERYATRSANDTPIGAVIGVNLLTDYHLDDFGRTTKIASGHVQPGDPTARLLQTKQTFVRDGHGNVVSAMDTQLEAGVWQTLTRSQKASFPLNPRETRFTYDYDVDPEGKTFGNLVSTFSDFPEQTSIYEATFGGLLSTTDAIGNKSVLIRFNDRPEGVEKSVSPTGQLTVFHYTPATDDGDLVEKIIAPNGLETTFVYDGQRRPTLVTQTDKSATSSNNHEIITETTYGKYGNPDIIKDKYSDGSATIVRSITDLDFDEHNYLEMQTVKTPSGGDAAYSDKTLSKATYVYHTTGLVDYVEDAGGVHNAIRLRRSRTRDKRQSGVPHHLRQRKLHPVFDQRNHDGVLP